MSMTNALIKPEDLTAEIVKSYICPQATDQEVMFFLQLCKAKKLNPFMREAYLIKFGEKSPASIVVGKETFLKRAASIPQYNGFRAGIVVLDNAHQITQREGALMVEGEKLLGGWAEVYRKDWSLPLKVVVSTEEYLRRDRDGKPLRPWQEMPATMIRKVAIVQAHREAFPEEFGGMYSPEEMPVDSSQLPTYKIEDTAKIEPPKARLAEVLSEPDKTEKAEEVVEEPKSLTETQFELWAALMDLYEGDIEKASQRLYEETTFKSKRDGRLIQGYRDITKIKDVSCHIILKKIKKELEQKETVSLKMPYEEDL